MNSHLMHADSVGEAEQQQQGNSSGVTLLSQLASMPSMSPLITSPVPSVGSVVPNMQATATISNGLAQQSAPEVQFRRPIMTVIWHFPIVWTGC